MSNIEHLTAAQEASEAQQQLFPQQIDTLFSSIDARTVEQFYHGYQLWSVERQIELVQLQVEALEQKIEQNNTEMLQKQPSSVALATLTQLQAYGVTDVDLLERMLERGDDWLDHTMQLLAHCEHYNMIGSSYSEWCEHALDGAYDWVESITKITSAELPTPSTQSEEAIIETESLLLQKLMSEDEETKKSGPQPRITRPLAENELLSEHINKTTPEASLPLIDTEEMEEGTDGYLLDTSIDAFISALTDGVLPTSEGKPETQQAIEVAEEPLAALNHSQTATTATGELEETASELITEEAVETTDDVAIQDISETASPEETMPDATEDAEEEQHLFSQDDTSSDASDTAASSVTEPLEPAIDEIATVIIPADAQSVEQEAQQAIEEQATISMSVDELHPEPQLEIDEIDTLILSIEDTHLDQPEKSDEDEYATVAMTEGDLTNLAGEKQVNESQAVHSESGEDLSTEDASEQKVEHEEDGTIFVRSLDELEGASKAKETDSLEDVEDEATIVIRAIQPTQPLIVQRPQREIEPALQPAYYEFAQEQQAKVEQQRDIPVRPPMPVSVPQSFQYPIQNAVPPRSVPVPTQEEKKPKRGFWWRILAFFGLRRDK